MFDRLRNKLNVRWFDLSTRGIFSTPPVQCDPASELVIVSQLHPPAIGMYLLAAKSFARYVTPREFVVVADRLTEADRACLARHFSNIRFIPIGEVDTGRCLRGGTWERIITIARECANGFVVQLDSDTLTINPPTTVVEHIRHGVSFTLGTRTGRAITDLVSASAFARNSRNRHHVQFVAERAFDQLPDAASRHYVRGCSGFAGFARNSVSFDDIEAFSLEVEQLIGTDKWREWGSEQVTSNYLVANIPGAQVLPIDEYPFFGTPDCRLDSAALIHFYGVVRYDRGTYRKEALRLIRSLGKV